MATAVIEDPREGRVTPESAAKMMEGLKMKEEDRQAIINDVALSNALQDYCMSVAERIKNGGTVDREEMFREMNRIAEQFGCESGIPFPYMPSRDEDSINDYPLVLADRSPLKFVEINQSLNEAAQRLAVRGFMIRNSWHRLGDESVSVVRTERGPYALREPDAGGRLRKILAEFDVRQLTQQSVEAEFKAMESMKSKVNENQYRLYVLCGSFVERSDKSDIHYVFRKGKPTIAISFHGDQGGRVLAALCMHPMGYYAFTHVGLMCPTDEVIAALLMMRGDERRFWAKSGQWHAADPRSGI